MEKWVGFLFIIVQESPEGMYLFPLDIYSFRIIPNIGIDETTSYSHLQLNEKLLYEKKKTINVTFSVKSGQLPITVTCECDYCNTY